MYVCLWPYTHNLRQCSHASVGLTQARSKYIYVFIYTWICQSFLAEICNWKMNFICNLIHVLLKKGCNPKPWQQDVGYCLDPCQMNLECNWDDIFWVKSTFVLSCACIQYLCLASFPVPVQFSVTYHTEKQERAWYLMRLGYDQH